MDVLQYQKVYMSIHHGTPRYHPLLVGFSMKPTSDQGVLPWNPEMEIYTSEAEFVDSNVAL